MSSTDSIVSMSISWASGRAGAKPMPQTPITMVVTPWPLLGERLWSKNAWPS